jgi:POT family proton-dependent oligopeptide transporter
MSQNTTDDFSKPLGHPAGFVLFFTEMERFYYGMRALLVLFLTSSLAKAGHEY